MDAWVAADLAEPVSPEVLYRDILDHLSIKMRLTVVDIRADDPNDWYLDAKRAFRFVSRLINVQSLLTGRIGDFSDQSFMHQSVLPHYQKVIAGRKPAIDFVNTRILGLNVGYDRIVLPQKTNGRPEWLISMTEGRFLVKPIDTNHDLDVSDERITQLLMEGLTSKEIAAEIGMSHRTVEHRLDVLKGRYGARNIVHLVTMLFGNHLRQGRG